MCRKFILVSNLDKIESRFQVHINQNTLPIPESFSLGVDNSSYVITSENPHEIQVMKFGMTPFWAKTPMDLINARAEGNKNSDMPDSISYHLQLKETPRIGEYIEFENVPGNRFERGMVHEVRHVIQGKTQIIEIYAHPLETDYDRWMKLKEKYESHQRWLRQLELSNKRI